MAQIILIYVTHGDETSAQKFTDQLLEERLIACSNQYPINSSYRWKGEIVREGEIVTIIKTSTSIIDQVISKMKEIHPYKTPCIIWEKQETTESYAQWVEECVT